MSTLTESRIEEFAIGLFEQLGYRYLYGPDIDQMEQDPNVHRMKRS